MTCQVYISTTRADYRLAKALVTSIEANWSDPRVIILPDDDFSGSHMFGHPVWRPSDPRVRALDRYYKKLRVFWGPAERFIYLDADELVLRPLEPLVRFLEAKQGPFFCANRATRAFARWSEGGQSDRARMVAAMVGAIDDLRSFDPDYEWAETMPFNSGEFAASATAVDRDAMLETFEAAAEFQRVHHPGNPLCGSRQGLFMSDQGFLNYFMQRKAPAVRIDWIDDLHLWGGRSVPDVGAGGSASDLTATFIHWAGCPRPGPIPWVPGIPMAGRWRRHYRDYCLTRRDWRGFVVDAVDYTRHVARETAKVWRSRLAIPR